MYGINLEVSHACFAHEFFNSIDMDVNLFDTNLKIIKRNTLDIYVNKEPYLKNKNFYEYLTWKLRESMIWREMGGILFPPNNIFSQLDISFYIDLYKNDIKNILEGYSPCIVDDSLTIYNYGIIKDSNSNEILTTKWNGSIVKNRRLVSWKKSSTLKVMS